MQNGVSQKIQIFLSARNLKDLDFFSKSDPYITISFRRDFNAKSYIPIGRTQTINNNLNPNFQKSFIIDYIFESKQDIKFEIMDDDNGNDDFIGVVETNVGFLMGSKSQTSLHDVKLNGKNSGKLIVRCEKVNQSSDYYLMKWKALKLMNTDSFFDFWDKSDPFLKFLKIREDNTFVEVAKTQYVNNNLNPDWRQMEICSTRLHPLHSTRFKVECWDWQEDGNNQFIGECYLDVNQIIQNNMFPLQIPLLNPKKNKPGTLVLENFKIIKKPTFVDYLRGGLEINMIIAIDFTGSNGIPTSPNSLHYMNINKPNQYQSAINAVASILLNYDSDKRIPAFGFGAKPRYPNGINSNLVSHCFPLSGRQNEIEVFGYEHLMSTYCHALKNVEFSGPTWFRPIIQEAMKVASCSKNEGSNCYQVLLILTDGQIHDMDPTINLLVQNCNLPISIIVVGVGNADFTNMTRLDGDNGLYSDNGQKAVRDIVQFVPFRDVEMNPDLLAKELLAELPGQLVQYMMLIGKKPNIPPPVDLTDIITNSKKMNPMQNQQLLGMFQKMNVFAEDPSHNPNMNVSKNMNPNSNMNPNPNMNPNANKNPENIHIKNPYGQ